MRGVVRGQDVLKIRASSFSHEHCTHLAVKLPTVSSEQKNPQLGGCWVEGIIYIYNLQMMSTDILTTPFLPCTSRPFLRR